MSLDIRLNKPAIEETTVFDANITHNLGKMASEANIYGILWRPEENDITHAWQLIEPLRLAIDEMKDDPNRFKKHDADNGWGTYKDFLPWLERLLEACVEHPGAIIRTSR